jgi:hypothetical protein
MKSCNPLLASNTSENISSVIFVLFNVTEHFNYIPFVCKCEIDESIMCKLGKGCTMRNHDFFDQEFRSKKNPIWFFCTHVQFHQNDILDKSIWTQVFWLGLFGWFFLLDHHDNNIIRPKKFYLNYLFKINMKILINYPTYLPT